MYRRLVSSSLSSVVSVSARTAGGIRNNMRSVVIVAHQSSCVLCRPQQHQPPLKMLLQQQRQRQRQQVRFMMYNPNQRKPSNKKKKRKLKRKARKELRREQRDDLLRQQGPKISRIVLLSLPYPVKLKQVVQLVDDWYDSLEVDFAFREVLLQHNGWFPIRFVATRLAEWTNHSILINSFVQVPDRYNIRCLYSIHGDDETFLPPLPESFAVEAAKWRDYEFDEEDFHEDDWFDIQTDLDAILQKLQLVDDSKDYDALFYRHDYPLERIRQIHDEANQQSQEVLQQYPRLFGTDEERNPTFGYDFSATTTATATATTITTTTEPLLPSSTTSSATTTTAPTIVRPDDVFVELERILSKRKQ